MINLLNIFVYLLSKKHIMRRLILLTIILVQLICSCANKGETNSVINLDKTDKVSIFDLVDSISVIKLETTKESLLKMPRGIIFHKNRFYLFDPYLQTVFCFDSRGKLLFKLNKKGRGPDEYTYAAMFNIDPFNDQLMILVPWGIILYYDLDGKFISKVKLPSDLRAYNEVYAIDKDNLLFYTWGYEYKAYYYSKISGKILKGTVATTSDLSFTFPPFDKSYYYKDSLYFNSVGIKNEVLNMSDTSQRVSYSWNFGDKNYTEEQMKELVIFDKNNKKMVSKESVLKYFKERNENPKFPAYSTNCSFETDRFRVTSLRYREFDNSINIVKDKNEGREYVFRETTEGVKLYFNFVSGRSIIMHYNENKDLSLNKVLSAEQLKVVESHNPEYDNPFLVIFHFK
jgi:hypothetical protein